MRENLEKGTPSPQTAAFVGMFTKSTRSNVLHLSSRLSHRKSSTAVYTGTLLEFFDEMVVYSTVFHERLVSYKVEDSFVLPPPQKALFTYTQCCIIGPLF